MCRIFVILCLTACFAPTGVAQLCGQWTVSIEVVDAKGNPVNNASVEYQDVPEGDAAAHHPFTPKDGAPNILVSTFSEGDRASKSYNLLIRAAGYDDLRTSTKVTYCYKTQETKTLNPNASAVRVSGVVLDQADAIIPDTTVSLTSKTNQRLESVTDKDGRFTIYAPKGEYVLEARYTRHSGWQVFRRSMTLSSARSGLRIVLKVRTIDDGNIIADPPM